MSADATRHRVATVRLLSLKWKAFAATTAVLVGVTLLLSVGAYQRLTGQFAAEREREHARHVREAEALLEQSLVQLQQVANLLAGLPGVAEAVASRAAARLDTLLKPQWPTLEVDLGLEVARFFDAAGAPLGHDESSVYGAGLPPQAPVWVRQVLDQEAPVVAFGCARQCLLYALVPILGHGHNAGALLLGVGSAELVHKLQRVTGSEVGLLVEGRSAAHADNAGGLLEPWPLRSVALTGGTPTASVLRAAVAQRSLAAAQTPEGDPLYIDERHYDLHAMPLGAFGGYGSPHWVFVTDITPQWAEIGRASRMILLTGLGGWLLAEALLLLILHAPMSRLQAIAEALPLLAQRRFGEFRHTLGGLARRRGPRDETDALGAVSLALCGRLEQLEDSVLERTRSLAERMEDLARERDFVTNLLRYAPVAVVTVDRNGRIVLANALAESLSGHASGGLLGTDFVELLGDAPGAGDRGLLEVLRGDIQSLRSDSPMRCADGTTRQLTWVHSRLRPRTADAPVMLSVGLDVTEHRGLASRLNWLSRHDPLTGLCNREALQEELRLLIAAARREQVQGALLLVDLDQFKYVNDVHGHHWGDALLQAVTQVLRERAPSADAIGRLGGDEFGVVLGRSDVRRAGEVAAAIEAGLRGLEFSVDDHALRVSASIGVVLFPRHGESIEELLANADLAMYRAKDLGRGNWQVFSPLDNAREQLHHRIYWRERVAEALTERRFELHYQPIVDVRTQRVTHYEALLRMRDTDGELVAPGVFIEAAERSGLIHQLDRLVLSMAMEFLGSPAHRRRDTTLAVNLSGRALNDPRLLPHIRDELARHAVAPQRLIFEITETAAVGDFAAARQLIEEIRQMGCRFALDDFGVGFSSFQYLKHLPVDYLKIDGSFIRQLPSTPEDQVIVAALSQVAQGFGKRTIAEFVEDADTLALLARFGVDMAQGYHVGRPLPAADLFGARSRAAS